MEDLTVGEHFGTRDQVVRWNIYVETDDFKKGNQYSKNFFKADYDKIMEEQREINLPKKKTESALEIIKKELNLIVEKYIPSRGRNQKSLTKRLTKEVIKAKREKHKAWQKFY